MYLKKLKILETAPKHKLIREIKFKLGCNFIVDAGENQEKSNSIGKTTALKLIDICFGARDRKYIYTDPEIGTNTELKNYIERAKIQVQLDIIPKWDSSGEKIHLAVDLFPNGKVAALSQSYSCQGFLLR